jgi:hypothetical protein
MFERGLLVSGFIVCGLRQSGDVLAKGFIVGECLALCESSQKRVEDRQFASGLLGVRASLPSFVHPLRKVFAQIGEQPDQKFLRLRLDPFQRSLSRQF